MRKVLYVVLGSAIAFVGVVGLAHMPFARTLLARAGGCPFPTAMHTPTIAEADARRVESARRGRGIARATVKPALGFTLGATTRAEVRAWADAASVVCRDDGIGLGVRCADVPLGALPGHGEDGVRAEVSFGFDPADALVSASFIARVPTTAAARALSDAAETPLAVGGPPTRTSGGSVERAFEQHTETWAYADYLGEVSTTHLGTGVVVTARHLSIPD